jgi:hypothetical protein
MTGREPPAAPGFGAVDLAEIAVGACVMGMPIAATLQLIRRPITTSDDLGRVAVPRSSVRYLAVLCGVGGP